METDLPIMVNDMCGLLEEGLADAIERPSIKNMLEDPEAFKAKRAEWKRNARPGLSMVKQDGLSIEGVRPVK